MSVHRAGLTVWILVVVQAKSATRQDGTEAWGGNPNRNLVAWDGVHDTVVHTHAPVLRWASRVDCGGLFTFRVLVNLASNGSAVWDSGEVFQQRVPSFPGIAVVEGPALRAGLAYAWSVHERQVANASGADARRMGTWLAGSGTFNTAPAPQFPTPQAELVAELTSENISALWNGSWHSVVDRIRPSGFLPTSVSGGYGGIKSQYVRDASGQLIGLMELGEPYYPVVARSLRFMLTWLQTWEQEAGGYAPHVMVGNPPALDKIVGVDVIDQADDTFYLISAWGRYTELSGDHSLETAFYPLLRNFTRHYCAGGARSTGSKGTEGHGGVPYFNTTLSLLWNPNLEHSRLGNFWSCYDALTNSFAAEGLRIMSSAAMRANDTESATRWVGMRRAILSGLASSLSSNATTGQGSLSMYAELRGHVQPFPCCGHEDEDTVGYSPLLAGLSYENVVPIVLALSSFSGNTTTSGGTLPSPAARGLDLDRMDRTFDAYQRYGQFLWVPDDPTRSAMVANTHINISGVLSPPFAKNPNQEVIGKFLGWEIGYAAYRQRWTRLIALHRWLGSAAHVEMTTLFAESYDYDCLRRHAWTAGGKCWGDPGNGVQIGWFLWGEALLRRTLELPVTPT